MNTRLFKVLAFGAAGSALFGMQACGTNETGSHPGIIGDSGTGGVTATGGSGNSTGGSTTVSAGPIGKACKTDSDCVTKGVVCVPVTSNLLANTGPAGGICTIDCSNGDDTTCQAVDPNALCVGFGLQNSEAYCLEACSIGTAAVGQTKCHGRKDMACDPSGFCDPVCRNDTDCGGRKCDPGSGRCVDKLPGGDATGVACDPTGTTSKCAGICIPLGTGIGACAQLCTLGQAGCGFDPTSSGPIDSFCAFVSDQTETDGDLGFCGQLCDCNGDCRDKDFVCSALPATLAQQVGRAGNCVPPATDTTTGKLDPGIACSGRRDGGADSGAGGKGGGGAGGTAGHGGETDSGTDAH